MSELPPSLDDDLWQDFLAYRIELKKPMSEYAQKAMLTRLRHYHVQGYDCSCLLLLAMSENWQGVYLRNECLRPKAKEPYVPLEPLASPSNEDREKARVNVHQIKRGVR